MKTSPTYTTWRKMRERCNNPKHHNFCRYGGRGIRVCERWSTFAMFLQDMGERPTGATIDRINNALGYEPGNCRWATPRQQAENSIGAAGRRIVREWFGGDPMTVDEAMALYGMSRGAIYAAVRRLKARAVREVRNAHHRAHRQSRLLKNINP